MLRCFREFSKERGKAAARGEYQKNKAKNQIDEDMKVNINSIHTVKCVFSAFKADQTRVEKLH